VKLARGIAEKVIRREIESLPVMVVENIELAVQRIGDRSQIIIEVNPTDLSAVVQFLPALRKKFEGCEGAEVIGVDSISAGGCRVKSRSSSVDLTVGTQLDLIELALIQDKQES
jgi:flagellar biosynthesis/type III secretory pathway protein FliH